MIQWQTPDLISRMPGLLIVKDLHCNVTGVTNELAKALGFNSHADWIDKTDFDIPCRVSEFAEVFQEYDRLAMKNQEKVTTIDYLPYADGWKNLIAQKSPLYDSEGKLVSVQSTCLDIQGSPLSRSMFYYVSQDVRIYGRSDQPYCYLVTTEKHTKNLTLRQQECMFYLLRGYSYKEIGTALDISPRTVEDHIQNLYVAFDCSKKSELIEKAIHEGYLKQVPKTLLKMSI